jgi:hypothetical protein
MKNRGTNQTTESAEKSSVSSKRIAPLPPPFPLCVGEGWNEGEIVGLFMIFNIVRLKEGIKTFIIQRAQRGGNNNFPNPLKFITSLGPLWLDFDNTLIM